MAIEEALATAVIQWGAKKLFRQSFDQQKCFSCKSRNEIGKLACCNLPVCDICIGGMLTKLSEDVVRFKCAFCDGVADFGSDGKPILDVADHLKRMRSRPDLA